MTSRSFSDLAPVGAWRASSSQPVVDASGISQAIQRVREPIHVVRPGPNQSLALASGGQVLPTEQQKPGDWQLMGSLPALYPEWLGDRSFCEAHNTRFAYVGGEMANGIATTTMVIEFAKAGMLGFFGAAGLGYDRVVAAVDELERTLGTSAPWGVNLIHSPNETSLEDRVAELLIKRNVPIVSASAFMGLTAAIVRCAASGLHLDSAGQIVRKRRIFTKISRAEVAARFMSPAPVEILQGLVQAGHITAAEAELASRVPVAEDVTVEADSGGHTDNQSLVALFPAISALRDEMIAKYRYSRPIRIGAAGGLGTPGAVAAAFGLGAAYVVTGSINQAAIESGLSSAGKQLLAQADIADVVMAPAADMFEMGVKVQVLRRGTMFAQRASKLYEAYHSYPSLEAMPAAVREKLERDVLHATIDAIWDETRSFWLRRDAAEVQHAEKDPKHKMALVFRWYLGLGSKWAIAGEPSRRTDYQIWCGPAMGAFNRWTAGSFLADPSQRTVVQIAKNLLEGASVITRCSQLRTFGVAVPSNAFHFAPRPLRLAALVALSPCSFSREV